MYRKDDLCPAIEILYRLPLFPLQIIYIFLLVGIQVTVSSQSVAIGNTTTEMSWATIEPFTSTPLKASRPAKRPRVELEEDTEMGNISSSATDPYDPARSVTAETESSQVL